LLITVDNFGSLEQSFAQVAVDLEAINQDLSEAKTVTEKYLTHIATLQKQLDMANKQLPGALKTIAWFITIALIWLGFNQIGLMIRGLEMIGLTINNKKDTSRTNKVL
jgi:hypothetical protein